MSFYVTIQDGDGKEITIEVTLAIFELFEEERKANERYRKERERHHTDQEFLEDTLVPRTYTPSVLDTMVAQSELNIAKQIIQTCTPIQQRRFYYNRILGYSFVEIARIENCSEAAVKKSVKAVVDKLKNFFPK